MAQRIDVQYVQFYTQGSAAQRVVPVAPIQTGKMPQVKKRKVQRIYVDPVAITGIVVAVVMLIVMLVGLVQFGAAHSRQVELENYVASLQRRNAILEETYYNGFDLEEIRSIALARGMIPVEQAQVLYVPAEQIQPQEESRTLWTILADLFA